VDAVAFSDFFGPTLFSKEFQLRHYQLEPQLSQEILCQGGRGGGKSLGMEFDIIHKALQDYEHEEAVVTAFRKAHVKDRMEGVITMMGRDRLIKEFLRKVDGREPINRQPRYEIHFYRRGTVYGCAVGEDKNAVSIQGLHPRRRYMEESQYFPDYAWTKFMGTASEKGTVDRFYGIRDGRRGTPWWEWDTKVEDFIRWKGGRYAYTRRWGPYYDTTQFKQDVAAYGGEDNPEFKNQVDGEWGEPTYGEWNMQHVNACVVAGDKLHHHWMKAGELADGANPELIFGTAFRRSTGCERVRFAIDCQYAEPTCVLIWEKIQRGKDAKWTLTNCVWLAGKMDHEAQAKCIVAAAKAVDGVEMTGLDATGGDGRGITMALERISSPYCGEIIALDWKNKLVVEFQEGASTEEIKITVKDNAIRTMRNLFATQSVWLPESEKMISDLMSETRKRTEGGLWVLKTPSNVHIPEAMRVFAHLLYLTDEAPTDGDFLPCSVIGTAVSTGLFRPVMKKPKMPDPSMRPSGMIVIR
jgi:hypothetical protein